MKQKRTSSPSSTESILLAARKLFVQRGYGGVNLDAIAKKAGVARQTLYNNFGSKEALFRAMLDAHWAGFSGDDAFEGLDEIEKAGASAEEILREVANRMVKFVEDADQISFTRLVISESRRLPWIGKEFYDAGKGPLVNGLAELLRGLSERKLLDCPKPLLAAHQFFGLILELMFWPYVMAIGPATSELPLPEEAVDEAIRMFMARYATS